MANVPCALLAPDGIYYLPGGVKVWCRTTRVNNNNGLVDDEA
jgi:hypothetical protein